MVAITAFLEAFQKVADMATGSKGKNGVFVNVSTHCKGGGHPRRFLFYFLFCLSFNIPVLFCLKPTIAQLY